MRGIIFGQVQCMRGMDFVAGGGDERYGCGQLSGKSEE